MWVIPYFISSILALIAGYDIQKNIFESYLKLMELNYKKSIISLESEFPWEITENWEYTFPFTGSSLTNIYQNHFPPIYVGINIEPNNSSVSAIVDDLSKKNKDKYNVI